MYAAILLIGTVLAASAPSGATTSSSVTATDQADVRAQPAHEHSKQASGKNPYGRLFTPRSNVRALLNSGNRSLGDAREVCGMKVIPVDPGVDRKMVIPIPPQAHKESRIRVVELPRCAGW